MSSGLEIGLGIYFVIAAALGITFTALLIWGLYLLITKFLL